MADVRSAVSAARTSVSLMGQFQLHRSQNPTSEAERNAVVAAPVFGRRLTDHMAIMDYTEGKGWHNPRLVATEAF